MQNSPIVIFGGGSVVGSYLMQHLNAEGMVADVIARRPVAVPQGFQMLQMDLTTARNWIAPEGAMVISLVPLWVLAPFLPRFIGVHSIVALSSTSRFSKRNSADAKERHLAVSLEMAENILQTWCLRGNVIFTILRPTMIYDGRNDLNIARIMRFIRRFRFFPLAKPAKGLRQPIHADDVAKAIVAALGNTNAYNKAFNIAGGEVLTYRAMVERIFAALKMKPRLWMLPTEWLHQAFNWVTRLHIMNEKKFGASVFDRMNQDLVFDVDEGLKALNYQPRGFAPDVSQA